MKASHLDYNVSKLVQLSEGSPEKLEKNRIYSAPVSELGSTTNLNLNQVENFFFI